MRTYEVISGDGHLETPADVWTPRVPTKYRDLAPRLVEKEDGSSAWVMGEFERVNWGNLVCDLPYDEIKPGCWTYTYADGSPRPGTGSASQRLSEQDRDGIDAEVLFPPVYGPKFLRQMVTKDKGAYLSFVTAYNSWLGEEYCATAPDRLIGNAILPETGVDDAISEMERCKELGLRAVCLGMFPNGGNGPTPDDDRFWAAALDLGMRTSAHSSFGGAPPVDEAGLPVDGRLRAFGLGMEQACSKAIVQMISAGVFDRFPDIRIYFAETHASWLPYALTMMDEFFARWYSYFDVSLPQMPSDYFRQHCLFNFVDDRLAMQFRYYIGTEMLTWGSDFPHSLGTYPHSREIIEDLFDGVPDDERRLALVENVCNFYGLDPDRDITPTPSPALAG